MTTPPFDQHGQARLARARVSHRFILTAVSFFAAGLAGGITVTIINFQNEGFTLITPFYYSLAAGVGGFIWILFQRFLNASESTGLFLVACMTSAIIAGVVLLQFGYSLTNFSPDPDTREYVSVSVAFAAGGLTHGLVFRRLMRNKTPQASKES